MVYMKQPKQIKLAFLTSKLDKTAREEGFIVDWVEALANQVGELVIFILETQKTKLKAKNIKVYSLGQRKTKIGKLIYLFNKFNQENKEKSFQGIFSHMYDFLGVAAGILGKVYKVKTIMWYAWGLELNRFTLAELALRLNDEIVTCSQKMKKRYQSAYQLKQPIHVLGHAINTAKFKKHRVKKKEKIFSIGFVGRAIPEKNIELILKAVYKVNKKKPIRMSLVIAGVEKNGDYLKKIRKIITKLTKNNLQFKIIENLPHEKIPNYLKTLDLYVHPALVYSIDKSPLEAISSGIPVLLSKYGYKELCKEYPQILFDPDDIYSLATKIDYAITNYDQFSQNQKSFQKYIRKSFSTDIFMKKLVKLFN